MLPSQCQTHHAERRKMTSPAWICRGYGRTSLDPENWSLSRRIWSHGWYYTGEGDPQHFPGLEPLLLLLHHPQILCPGKRGEKDLMYVLNETPIQPFSCLQVLLSAFHHLPASQWMSIIFSFPHLFLSWCSLRPSSYITFTRSSWHSPSPLTFFSDLSPATHPSIPMSSATSVSHLAVAGDRCRALKCHLRIPLRGERGFPTPWNTSPWALACLLFWWVLG